MSMTLEQALELGFRAGFIRACNWPAPVSQDVDSPAFSKELAQFIEAHTPITQPAQSVEVEKVSEALRSARRVAHLYHTGEGMLWYIEKQLETTAALQEKGNG